MDENAITIGIVNAGARDSFTRSGSEDILRAAFVDVTGLDLKIECVVDASANTSAPSSRATEDPSDADQIITPTQETPIQNPSPVSSQPNVSAFSLSSID